jgi:hypothetical protein
MVKAMRYPEGEKGGRGNKRVVETTTVSLDRVARARAVLRHSRTLAESVLKGITPLDTALATVRQEQQYQQSDEAKLAETPPAVFSCCFQTL